MLSFCHSKVSSRAVAALVPCSVLVRCANNGRKSLSCRPSGGAPKRSTLCAAKTTSSGSSPGPKTVEQLGKVTSRNNSQQSTRITIKNSSSDSRRARTGNRRIARDRSKGRQQLRTMLQYGFVFHLA